MSRAGFDRWIRDLKSQVAVLGVLPAIEDTFGPYRDNPVGFCRDVLGVESAKRRSNGDEYEFGVLSDLAQHERFVPTCSEFSGAATGVAIRDATAEYRLTHRDFCTGLRQCVFGARTYVGGTLDEKAPERRVTPGVDAFRSDRHGGDNRDVLFRLRLQR
jgi:hypothetical protein